MLDSHTKLGGDKLAGTFTVGSSTNGLIRVDGNLSGSLAKAKGWYYSLGAFASYDPTSVNAPSRMLIDQCQIYQGAVSKRWASARYYSKQYASRTNLAWFNGHWETFAGIDWQVIKSLKLSVNVVNALFQDGAKGSIDIADTITDSSQLNNYVMSGTYISPFHTHIKT